MSNELPDWLVVGQKVGIMGREHSRVGTVVRLTATQVIVDDPSFNQPERRFRRDTLKLVGDSWGARLCDRQDPALQVVIAQRRARLAINEIRQGVPERGFS